jgi:hypothetical protein
MYSFYIKRAFKFMIQANFWGEFYVSGVVENKIPGGKIQGGSSLTNSWEGELPS